MKETVLEVKDLVTTFKSADGPLPAVRGASFSVKKGETLCIVGESGCGKSITALSVMGLLPSNGLITAGSISFNQKNLAEMSPKQMQKVRGNDVSMIFQEPMTALNPVFTIGFQIREPLMIHLKLSKKQAHMRGIELLKMVGIPSPVERMNQFPHELSGGMRQRVMIAIALSCNPSLLIADEPTTALDVTIQAQIIDLLNDLKEQLDMSMIMITHDMGVVAEIADRVIVMYAGEIIEEGRVEEIFENPQHPYTKGLLASVPNVDDPEFDLKPIAGSMPMLNEQISGCRFHPRCPYAFDKCMEVSPKTFHVTDKQSVRCWLQEEGVEQNGGRRASSL
ncbi:ABC transporter ATP-binding protein [Fictibacillus phosphorivorans]|uniref:ABC transporter ATP-binding protein n=1 Tax=Fictibacillus phosphorivorans TaxID=1221500 RepID=UPI001293B859|nr:ABC transporter ATP-binding protein [Fictibacillus phosphorivorans]MQR95890.1 ABC transporter ATP-binding protein [Fictibacillus phosphorivorans]